MGTLFPNLRKLILCSYTLFFRERCVPSQYDSVLKCSIFLLSFSFYTLGDNRVFALSDPNKKALVLLQSEITGACGSGVVLRDGIVITAAHLARDLCPNSNMCDGLKISKDEEPSSQASATIQRIVPSLDLAQLSIPGITGKTLLADSPPVKGDSIYTLSYPGCEEIKKNRGRITSIDSLWLFTNSKGNRGSSGGALFDSSGALLGIIDESASARQALMSSWFGTGFNLRAVRVPALQVFDTSEEESILKEATLLNKMYETYVEDVNSSRRLLRGNLFLGMGEYFKSRLGESSLPSEYGRNFLELSSSVKIPTYHSSRPLSEEIERLALSLALERLGPFDRPFHLLDPNSIKKIIMNSPRSADQKEALTQRFQKAFNSGYTGYELMMITSIVTWGCLILVFIFLWSWTLGFTWARVQGTFLRHIAFTLFVGLFLWPISFLVFWKKYGKSEKTSSEPKPPVPSTKPDKIQIHRKRKRAAPRKTSTTSFIP